MANEFRNASSDVLDPGISSIEATHLAHADCQIRLAQFMSALDMQQPVSNEKIAILLKHIVRDRMASDAEAIAGQIRIDHWERALGNGDNPDVLAARASAFLQTTEGRELYAYFDRMFNVTASEAV